MAHERLLGELDRRRAAARRMGGPEKLARRAKRGQLKMGTLNQLMAEIEGNQPEETKLLPLRIAISDIERAKAQAEKKGIGHQTYLKSLLHRALTAGADPRWAVAAKRRGLASRRRRTRS